MLFFRHYLSQRFFPRETDFPHTVDLKETIDLLRLVIELRRIAPITGTMFSPLASTQAIAICEALIPFPAARSFSTATSFRFRARFSPENPVRPRTSSS
jgi:hypothetical protein